MLSRKGPLALNRLSGVLIRGSYSIAPELFPSASYLSFFGCIRYSFCSCWCHGPRCGLAKGARRAPPVGLAGNGHSSLGASMRILKLHCLTKGDCVASS
eukprot:5670978-Amphidinium_carterae.2